MTAQNSHKGIVFITGATSGIGWATAIKFAIMGFDIIITGRRIERLQLLTKDISQKYNVRVLALTMDIQNKDDIYNQIDSLQNNWKNISILINNAGLAQGFTDILHANIEEWQTMLQTNFYGLLVLTKKILPLMIDQGNGHIINVGSIAGMEVYPNGNVYCATKHAVSAITKALRIELLSHNIKVSSINPGYVETEFSQVRFGGDVQSAKKVYEGFVPLSPEDIAETIYFMASRPDHVNISDVLITPKAQANTAHIFKSRLV